MRLCVRLAVTAALLAAVAMGLIYLRTDTAQAGNRLHLLYRQMRDLEQECCRLEVAIAGLKNQERLRSQAARLRQDTMEDPGISPKSLPRGGGTAPVLVDGAGRGSP